MVYQDGFPLNGHLFPLLVPDNRLHHSLVFLPVNMSHPKQRLIRHINIHRPLKFHILLLIYSALPRKERTKYLRKNTTTQKTVNNRFFKNRVRSKFLIKMYRVVISTHIRKAVYILLTKLKFVRIRILQLDHIHFLNIGGCPSVCPNHQAKPANRRSGFRYSLAHAHTSGELKQAALSLSHKLP